MPLPWKLLKVPPMTVTSAAEKSVLDSLSVKVMVAVWPLVNVVLSLLTAMVGGVLSAGEMLMDTELLASAPSLLKLPAASENLFVSTTKAALEAPAVGVKVAL